MPRRRARCLWRTMALLSSCDVACRILSGGLRRLSERNNRDNPEASYNRGDYNSLIYASSIMAAVRRNSTAMAGVFERNGDRHARLHLL